jgi:GT2 family glycosyltransferase
MLVSLIIPTYNRAALLDETLDSVLSQTYPNWECIVVDDGSTDETEAVVSSFGDAFQLIRQANAGPAVARNRGVAQAKGEAILFLDSDDLLRPYALDVLVNELRRHPEAGVSYGGFQMMRNDGSPATLAQAPLLPAVSGRDGSGGAHFVAYGLTATGQILPDLLQHDAMLMGATLIRREVVERIGGFDPERGYMEHWEYFLRIARERIPFVPTRTPVVRIRIHEGNLSGNFEDMLLNRLALIETYLPRDNRNASGIRTAARANAQLFLGMCLLYTERFNLGIEYMRQALIHRSLQIHSYDAFAMRVCTVVQSTENPQTQLESVLGRLGSAPNAQVLKHFVLSHFYRMHGRGGEAERASTSSEAGMRGRSTVWWWGYSGWHLLRAVSLQPSLAGRYLRNGLRKIRTLRPRFLRLLRS